MNCIYIYSICNKIYFIYVYNEKKIYGTVGTQRLQHMDRLHLLTLAVENIGDNTYGWRAKACVRG